MQINSQGNYSGAVSLYSGGIGNYILLTMLRSSTNLELGIAAVNGNFSSSSNAGDIILRNYNRYFPTRNEGKDKNCIGVKQTENNQTIIY